MSRDYTEHEYHLTTSGWISGTTSICGKTQEVSPPADRLETCLEYIDTSSDWDPPVEYLKTTWRSETFTDEARAELYKKFPPPKYVPWKKFKKKKRVLAD
jgi:hypothetical protein